MKYSIGYQLPDEFITIPELCELYDDSISNVFFSWANEPGGRLPLCSNDVKLLKEVSKVQLEELKEVKNIGKSLTLLLNANCYGSKAVSKELKEHILYLVNYLKTQLDIDFVTTTSPFIADCIKNEFKNDIKITASVNMRISTVRAMKQLSSLFDGYYIAKECNRDFETIKKLHDWCDKNGKTLHILANSGCMPYCGFQTFHDNFVAHQGASDVIDEPWDGLPSPCHRYLKSIDEDEALAVFMQSSWILPNEVDRYAAYFSEMKLATRMHQRMQMIIAAYARKKYRGNLLDLTEPSFSKDFKQIILDAERLDSSFFDTVTTCDKNCEECNFCLETVKNIKGKIKL